MIISSLRLCNFRSYVGDQQLEFSTSPQRNVSIVTGPNGAGKTGLFIALNWCLYGHVGEDVGRFISKASDKGPAFVEVRFRHEGTQYVARREAVTLPDGSERIGELTLRKLDSRGAAKNVVNPIQLVNEILPEDARQYFFFDGERIKSMTEAGHEEQVREAMRSVLKLKVLERTIAHLAQAEKEFASDLRKTALLDKDIKALIAEIEAVREDMEKAQNRRDATQTELEQTERQLEEVESSLSSIESISKIITRETQITATIGAKEERCSDIELSVRDLLARSGPAIATPAIRASATVLDEKRERGEIPSNVREQLIDDLLRDGTCICERPLDAASRKALTERLDSAASREVEDAVILATGHIAALHRAIDEVPNRISQLLAEYEDTRSDIDELQREFEGLRRGISEQLHGKEPDDVVEQAAGLAKIRKHLENRRADFRYELGGINGEITSAVAQESKLREQLQRSEAQTSAVYKETRRYEVAVAARQAAEDLLHRFHDDMRARIEAATQSIFKSLLWKEQHIKSVRILEDSRLDVIDRYGESALAELSAGERQLLSLSFIIGMSRVTGEEAPLVIDTPFGRVSEEPGQNMAEKVPGLAGQLILLVTDRELDEAGRRAMKDRIGADYFLRFDDDAGTTTIEEARA